MGVDLDDAAALRRLDSLDILTPVERLGEQCRAGWDIGRATPRVPPGEDIDAIAVLGMGGSAMAGDIAQAVVEPGLTRFLRVLKGYGPLPGWVGPRTLVVAVSYSGDTEETLDAAAAAVERGASLLSLSSGGRLAEAAGERGWPHVLVPGGLQPRASLGYLALPLLAVLERMGLTRPMGDDVAEAEAVLAGIARACDRGASLAANPAKQLAVAVGGKISLVYGGQGLAAVAARRFKCDLNEYAKAPAFANELPEMGHNEIEGFGELSDVLRSRAVVVELRDTEEDERLAERFEATRRILDGRVAGFRQVRATGSSALARLMSLVMTTQLAAVYAGLAAGSDPGPVNVIRRLKEELATRRGAE
ncbi:bifunctional phosphoglucose/phosphomannose isomerase [soil metagenome]